VHLLSAYLLSEYALVCLLDKKLTVTEKKKRFGRLFD